MYYDYGLPADVPPKGSKLEFYMRNFCPGPKDTLRHFPWLDFDWALCVIAVNVSLREEPRLWRHDPTFVKRYVVMPALGRLGFPKRYLEPNGSWPKWLNALVHAATLKLIEASGAGWPKSEQQSNYGYGLLVEEARASVKGQTGKTLDEYSKPAIYVTNQVWHDAIVAATFVDTLAHDMPDDERMTLIASQLGPGVHVDHIRFTLADVGSKLNTASEEGRALWCAATTRVSEEMRRLDQTGEYSKPKS